MFVHTSLRSKTPATVANPAFAAPRMGMRPGLVVTASGKNQNTWLTLGIQLSFFPFVDRMTPKILLFSLKSVRLRICILAMLGIFATVSMRTILGMAMVCMVNTTAFVETNEYVAMSFFRNASFEEERVCSKSYSAQAMAESGYHGTLLWSPSMQSLLFSATFYGGLITILPSGYLADRFGPKPFFILSVLDYSVVTILGPLLANTNFYAFLVGRLIMGLGEGFIMPTVSSLASRWFPPNERGAVAALYTSGIQLAGSTGGFVSASLCSLDFSGGWPLIFYTFGCLGCLWCVIFTIVASSSPGENKWISNEEKNHIISAVPHSSTYDKNVPVPWRRIMSSTAVLSILVVQFSFSYSLTTLQSFLPAYFRDILLLDVKSNGLYTVLPFLSQLIFKNVFGHLSDYLKRKEILSCTTSSKVFQSIGSFGSVVCFSGLAWFVNCETPILALAFLGMHGLCFSCGMSGFYVSCLSIAPSYTGVVMSMSMFFGTIGNALAPLTFGLVNSQGSDKEWRNVYLICAVLNAIAGVVFLVSGSGQIQVWAIPESPKKQRMNQEPIVTNSL
ncbi:hypothetical protein L596_020524 [Steinernema carpocapsae]|uniref:Major facilitator superfamily (MFS) profile domain-containing protein n=1 Tax=Steinernema carpocapsae TaxID=34508 RepID=A0A4U5MTZ5_STECR|nr:hypothetical protein L596_020524 [Steinernema carpocapsae]